MPSDNRRLMPGAERGVSAQDAGISAAGSSRGRWMALAAALLGWMFDGAEMGVFSMVGRSALLDLLPSSREEETGLWFGIIMAGFLVGAATGGVLFGWLGDRIGRVKAMTLSVLTYAVFTGWCGLATSAWQLGLLRFLAALGMGGEWSLGVALVMEVWPNRSRAFMAGLIGAAGNLGYLLVGVIGLGLAAILQDLAVWLRASGMPQDWVEILVRNQGWRILMILGVTPAILTFFIRLFVPESERWKREKESGSTSHWATRDLLGVLVGALGPALIIYLWAWPHPALVRGLGTLAGLFVAALGYMYPAARFLSRQDAAVAEGRASSWPTLRRMLLAAALSSVALLGTWGSAQWAPSWALKLTEGSAATHAKEYTQIWLAIGAILGTVLAALAGDWFGRRWTYAFFCVASSASLLAFYQGNTEYGPRFLASVFVVGLCTASFYGWLPLYLPELFSTRVRATGQGFGFNFGRILAAVGTLQTGNLFAERITIGDTVIHGGYPFACSVMSLIYVVGLLLITRSPETRGLPLPD